MSTRKRMNIKSIWKKDKCDERGGGDGGKGGGNEDRKTRRSSLSSFRKLNWATGVVQRSLTAAAVAAKDLFADIDEENEADVGYGAFYTKRGQSQRADFKGRYRHLVETLGNLSLAADVDAGNAATLLQHSGVREDLETMLTLLMAEERQSKRFEHFRTGGEGGGGSGGQGVIYAGRLAAPCLEFLLEERVVKTLCELGIADHPSGTMSLVLGAMAYLLGEVDHPLLPSQTVHEPIAKLVTAAGLRCRREGEMGGEGQDSPDPSDGSRPQHADSSAKRAAEDKLTSNLARLLAAIWRKLREESALLDFFFHVGNESEAENQHFVEASTGGAALAPGLRLDVFDRLLPLLELPGGAGRYAREACLVALSVKDERMGQFVADRTNFCEQLSRTLTARYLALYDTLEELQAACAAASSDPAGEERKEEAMEAPPSELVMKWQLDQAEGAFGEALSLFLQHLRFCNAVGLVASDTEACLRPRQWEASANSGDQGNQDNTAVSVDAIGVPKENEACSREADDIAASLACQLRQLLLGEAIGPALASALESRAEFAQAIAARTVTELFAGVEEYGAAVDDISASVGEGVECKRQLGPLLDTFSTFLVGRESPFGSWNVPVGDRIRSASVDDQCRKSESAAAVTAGVAMASTGAQPMQGSMLVINSKSGASLSLRDVLLKRMDSSTPSLRLSTLELIASLAALRDDRVLLDLALRPLEATKETTAPPSSTTDEDSARTSVDDVPAANEATRGREGENKGCRAGKIQQGQVSADKSVQPLLDNSPGGALEGLRVSPSLVDSFASAFGGSPIHPDARRHAASDESLEGYIIEAHQRQIQQLMEAARGCRLDEDKGTTLWQSHGVLARQESREGGGVFNGEAARDAGNADLSDAFDAEAFSREHGAALASSADTEGSFLHVLFDCLETMFERSLEENVAVTGVLSSLCLAATATEVSPVRRLLLVLLFDGTKGAPFRSMRRILETLWASARARISSLPNASLRLAQARSSLGMSGSDTEDLAEAPTVEGGGGQGSRGMKEELKMKRMTSGSSEARQGSGSNGAGTGGGDSKVAATTPAKAVELQQQDQQSRLTKDPTEAPTVEVGGGQGSRGMKEELKMKRMATGYYEARRGNGSNGVGTGGKDPKAAATPPAKTVELQQQDQESQLLETYVFLEEFLKELFSALSAKSHMESDALGLFESQRGAGSLALRVGMAKEDSLDEGDISPVAVRAGRSARHSSAEPEATDSAGDGVVDMTELPTSMDDFLREITFPAFLAPSVV